MKKIFYLFLLLSMTTSAFAQGEFGNFLRDSVYITMTDIVVTEYDFMNKKKLTTKKIANKGMKFAVINYVRDEGIYVIKFWNFKSKSSSASAAAAAAGGGGGSSETLSADDNGGYFWVYGDELEGRAEIYGNVKKWSLSFGTLIVPAKIRFGDNADRYFDFATDFTIGTSIGARYQLKQDRDYYINFLSGFGLTSVFVDSASTRGVIPTSTNLAAVTPAGGILLEFSGFQFGIFTGLDFISRRPGREWLFQGKPWISIGLGYQILSKNTRTRRPKKEFNVEN